MGCCCCCCCCGCCSCSCWLDADTAAVAARKKLHATAYAHTRECRLFLTHPRDSSAFTMSTLFSLDTAIIKAVVPYKLLHSTISAWISGGDSAASPMIRSAVSFHCIVVLTFLCRPSNGMEGGGAFRTCTLCGTCTTHTTSQRTQSDGGDGTVEQ